MERGAGSEKSESRESEHGAEESEVGGRRSAKPLHSNKLPPLVIGLSLPKESRL